MFSCVLACTTAAARVLMRMARGRLLPAAFERTSKQRGTPNVAVTFSATAMFAVTLAMSLRGVNGSDMYDLVGSLSVFGFLTVYALVAIALPFARSAVGQHSHAVAGISVLTVIVMFLIAIFDVRSSADPVHARIPYIYIAYIAAGVVVYLFRRKQAVVVAE